MAQVGPISGSSPHQDTMNSATSSPTSTSAIAAPIPVSFNLTPASDSFTGGRYLSSTRASVDSDSDYQAVVNTNAPTATPNRDNNRDNNNTSATPSRPVSRSSTFSGLSTTATKDGVEGKRVHRIHDPLGYATWLFPTSTTATPTTTTTAPPPSDTNTKRMNRLSVGSSVSSTMSSSKGADGHHHHNHFLHYRNERSNRSDDMDDGDDEAEKGASNSDAIDYDTENASPRVVSNDFDDDDNNDEDDDNMVGVIERRNRRDNYITANTTESIPDSINVSTDDINNVNNPNENSNEGDDEAEDDNIDNDQDEEESIHPPNIPSAPPVTLNEKIRLLRTGSVSGVAHPHHTHHLHHHNPGDEHATTQDGSIPPPSSSLHNGQNQRQDFYTETFEEYPGPAS